jgi:hypothetical protein
VKLRAKQEMKHQNMKWNTSILQNSTQKKGPIVAKKLRSKNIWSMKHPMLQVV